jgi:hypothetical protein
MSGVKNVIRNQMVRQRRLLRDGAAGSLRDPRNVKADKSRDFPGQV